MSSLFVLTLLFTVGFAIIEEFTEHGDCDKSRKELMYIYDPLLNECFAERVGACDEKAKERLYSLAQCTHKMAKTPRCANLSAPMKHSDGSSTCNSNDFAARKCPKGAVCKGSICCDVTVETDYLLEKYVTSCKGVNAIRENGQILFSRNCSIDFCPDGSTCTMGRNFAFCC